MLHTEFYEVLPRSTYLPPSIGLFIYFRRPVSKFFFCRSNPKQLVSAVKCRQQLCASNPRCNCNMGKLSWGYFFFISVTDVFHISEVQTSVDANYVAETDPYMQHCLPQLHQVRF
jgi:hypothetical protein